MTRKYFSKVFCVLLWISIFFVFSLILSPKVSAQVCTIEDYSPPVTPNPAFCTPYFPDTIAFPPCNSERVCSNKAFNIFTCAIGGTADGTQCCARSRPGSFCDQRSLGPGPITEYEFRCCNIPPPPTPTPTPSCVGSVGGSCNSTPCCSPLVCTAIDIYTKQCRGTPPPTPTPTLTAQKFLIKGVVYNDKNNNGVVDGNDTVFDGTKPGSPFITTSELFSGNFIGSHSLDQGGFYITSRIYQSGSFYKVLLNNIPQGCSSNRNPHNIQMPNSDATENFPLNCATLTPTPTTGPTPTAGPTP